MRDFITEKIVMLNQLKSLLTYGNDVGNTTVIVYILFGSNNSDIDLDVTLEIKCPHFMNYFIET